MKLFFIVSALLYLLSGCGEKGYGSQNLESIVGVTSTEKVKLLSSVPSETIAQKTYITLTFSSHMDIDSVDSSRVVLRDSNDAVIEIDATTRNNNLFVRPLYSLEDGMSYKLTLDSSLKDIFGNKLQETYILDFICSKYFWESVEAGATHSMALSKAKDLYVWGNNPLLDIFLDDQNLSQLIVDIPLPLPYGKNFKSYSTGSFSAGYISSNGEIYTNGLYDLKKYEESDFIRLSIGYSHSVVIKEDGRLYSWGSNDKGELGTLGVFTKKEPTQEYSQSSEWKSVSAGKKFTLALKNDGSLWGWGENSYGQIGNKMFSERRQPVQEDTNSTWKQVSAGAEYSSALKEDDNSLWSWGNNSFGQLGDGNNSSSKVAVQESSKKSWRDVATGAEHTLAIDDAGKLFTWGNNHYGQLGDNSVEHKNTPIAINPSERWNSISAGDDFSLAVKEDGTLWAWGHNSLGQLGIGLDQNDTLTPREVK